MWVANRAFISIINDLIFYIYKHLDAEHAKMKEFLTKILFYDQIKDCNQVSRSIKCIKGGNQLDSQKRRNFYP